MRGVGRRELAPLLSGVARRPDLWLTAALTARRHVPRHWWRRRPFLPLPDARWIGFRLETAYGDPAATLAVEDFIGFLEWCRRDAARAHGGRIRRRPRPSR